MATAYDMHRNWQPGNPRVVLANARKNGGTITPYSRNRIYRSWIVSWPERHGDRDNSTDTCEGHLYVIRCRPHSRK